MREIVREVRLVAIMAGIGVAVGHGRVWVTNLDTAWNGIGEGGREGGRGSGVMQLISGCTCNSVKYQQRLCIRYMYPWLSVNAH